jgi:hypothetical protein
MYHLNDSTTPGNQWIAQAVTEFDNNLTTRAVPESNPLYQGRTGYDRPGLDLFGIKPLDHTPARAQNAPVAPCDVCHERFVGGDSMDSTVVVLPCSDFHVFHLKCIFKFWDAPGKYLFTCPTCKSFPKLNFQRLNINPDDPVIAPDFQHNVFGWEGAGLYARTVPAAGIARMRDKPVLNPIRDRPPTEGRRILRQYNNMGQDLMRGYQGANKQPQPEAQATAILPTRFGPEAEMAYLRTRLRRRDARRRRRRDIEQKRLGLAGLFNNL